jgi:uncharacterized membrane protein YqiK
MSAKLLIILVGIVLIGVAVLSSFGKKDSEQSLLIQKWQYHWVFLVY